MRTAVAVDIVVIASFGMSPKPKSVSKLHFLFLSADIFDRPFYYNAIHRDFQVVYRKMTVIKRGIFS
jgi:hypothetical protein